MRRKIIVGVLLGISILCTGCMGSFRWIDRAARIYESEEDYDEDDSMTKREMTEEQMELLCLISVDEERVRKGELLDWQIEVLNQYDYAMEYLADKYPSYEFRIVYCEPENVINSYTTFTFVEKSDEETYYDLYLDVYKEEGAENRYEARDNFYGALFEDEFAEKMLELVQEKFPECVDAKSNITCVQGKEYGETLDLDRVLSGQLKMDQDTILFITIEEKGDAEYSEKVMELKEFIVEHGIYGSYEVRFVKGKNLEEVLYEDYFFGR